MPRCARAVLLCALTSSIVACVIVSHRTATMVRQEQKPQQIATPVKVYLHDGSIALFRNGGALLRDTFFANGTGASYIFPDNRSQPIQRIPLDSIAALEALQLRSNVGEDIVKTVVASAVATVGAAALYVVIFGSCPTVYSDSAGQQVLDAEIFANRISGLFEARDLDLLKAKPDANGVLRLEVRNEALETHYINVMEVLEAEHQANETVVLDERGKPVAIKNMIAPAQAVDALGRNVRAELLTTDGHEFSTSLASLKATTAGDIRDHIDVTFPNDPHAESAVTLRMRNSVLNSVLLYDVILNEQGLHAVDWLGVYMERVGSAVEFARWHHSRFGLRVFVRHDGAYQEVARHPMYGPIAWREVATVLPKVHGDSIHIRLSFIKDDWRIDRVSLAPAIRRLPVKRHPADRVLAHDAQPNPPALNSLQQPDEKYVQTYPGQRFHVEFDVGARDSRRSTFILASHGFYTEWVRGSWLKSARPDGGFRPSDEAIVKTIAKWSQTREQMTKQFFASKVAIN